MSVRKIIGTVLVASPFVLVAIVIVDAAGWEGFLFTFGSTALACGAIGAGLWLLEDRRTRDSREGR